MRRYCHSTMREYPADSSERHLKMSQAQTDRPLLLPVHCIKYKTYTSIVRYGNEDIFIDELWYGPDKIATIERFDPYTVTITFLQTAAMTPIGGRVGAINNMISDYYNLHIKADGSDLFRTYRCLKPAKKRRMPNHDPNKFMLARRNRAEVVNYTGTVVDSVRGYFCTENSKHGTFIKMRIYKDSQMSTIQKTGLVYAETQVRRSTKWKTVKAVNTLKIVLSHGYHSDLNYTGGIIAVVADDVEYDLTKLKLRRRLVLGNWPLAPSAFCSPATRESVAHYISNQPYRAGTFDPLDEGEH